MASQLGSGELKLEPKVISDQPDGGAAGRKRPLTAVPRLRRMLGSLMRTHFLLAVLITVPLAALAEQGLHDFKSVAIAPDGRHVASIETSDDGSDSDAPASLMIRDLVGGAVAVPLPCAAGPNCKVDSPTWNSSGQLAFLVSRPEEGVAEIDTVDVKGGAVRRLFTFNGTLDRLRYAPDNRLAVLATAQAHKLVGRAEAGAPIVGDIGSEADEQRIAVLDGATLKFVSPADLYVYEFDFLPNGGFVGTAAPGDGDSQWWVAKLYAFERSQARVLFAPDPREQLAAPAVSPDGKSVAFIGGWMSDFGSTGGDAYVLRLDQPGAKPNNLTAGSHATVTALDWSCGPGLTGTVLAGDTVAITRLDAAGAKPAWSGHESLAGGTGNGLSCGPHGVAAVSSSFASPPEIVAGPLGHWHAISHENSTIAGTPSFSAQSVTWRNEGFDVQGWLLQPAGGETGVKRPMVVLVHGGPEAASTNKFLPAFSQARTLLAAGWDVFEPNYRGSFGQGEAFAAASIQDLGGGDWRDVLTGVDAAERAAPIDDTRVGIMGGSYGGYMAMWGITQTHRFRAAVSHAGVSDWLSLEGEAPQAGSDQVNFGGSVYDDPTPYLKASPIMHMRGVSTPTLITVGERDLECPMPQSEEFYTALDALGVPVEFHVYPGEGHHLQKAADRADFRKRTVAWFQRWFAAAAVSAK
jgi:dipeptidyl aminopeptidase/acylaminoacyl peptidase